MAKAAQAAHEALGSGNDKAHGFADIGLPVIAGEMQRGSKEVQQALDDSPES